MFPDVAAFLVVAAAVIFVIVVGVTAMAAPLVFLTRIGFLDKCDKLFQRIGL
jgi:hypothetical protein